MILYSELFPEDNRTFCFRLERKTGSLPKGMYSFLDAYCEEPRCDCRRVALSVLNEKGKDLAHISFGFDPDGDDAGPYLEPWMEQSRHAEMLLDLFAEIVNTEPDFLEDLYARYRQVRERVDGRKYKGRRFPRPGSVVRIPQETPESLPSFEEFEKLLRDAVRTAPPMKGKRKSSQLSLLEESVAGHDADADGGGAVVRVLHSAILQDMKRKKFSGRSQAELSMEDEPTLAIPLIDLLAEEAAREGADLDERIHGGIMLLRAALERLREDMERGRPESAALNERLQKHIADTLIVAGSKSVLATEVVRNLADCRLEPLPLLAEAYQRMVTESLANTNVVPFPGADPLAEIVQVMANLGAESAFDRFAIVTEQFRLAPEEMQLQLAGEMAVHPSSVLREVAGLMPFHPLAAVREKVTAILAEIGGAGIGPETLRRLILSRNWHPDSIRPDIDRIITDARRAGVQCAKLREIEITDILASAVDGAGAQGLWMVGRRKGQFVVASVLVKLSQGIVDAWVTPPMPAAEMKRMIKAFRSDGGAQPVARRLAERMVGNGLAIGLENNVVVPVGLLEVAETMGIADWKPEPMEPAGLLASLRREIGSRMPLTVETVLAESEWWPVSHEFASSWFEDDQAVDNLLAPLFARKRITDKLLDRASDAVLKEILLPRRAGWLERLALTALWLASVRGKPPLAPGEMVLVAEQVASAEDFGGIGLMCSVADMTVDAYLDRQGA